MKWKQNVRGYIYSVKSSFIGQFLHSVEMGDDGAKGLKGGESLS